VRCDFTVGTTAIADLLANRATTSVTAGAGGNGALKAITDGGWTVAALGIVIPTTNCWITGYNLETDTICVVQLGLLNVAGDSFTPIDDHVCTMVAAGGIVRKFDGDGKFVPLEATDPYVPRFALKVSNYGVATAIKIAGSIDLFRL
jgi:hypothetical protein